MIALVVPWRPRHKLACRDLPEMFVIRGLVFNHEAVRDWETELTPALAENLWRHRHGKVGGAGTLMRRISRSTGTGVISIVPLIGPARWST